MLPDHVTIARFRSRHAAALVGVFVASLRLCAEAGLVRLGAVALDGTKIGANASADANRTLEALEKRIAAILAEAAELDAVEDQHEAPGGHAVPDTLVDPAARRAQLAAARERLEAAKARLEATVAQRAARFAARAARVNTARAAKSLPPREVKPRPRDEAPQPGATTNLTDPDSRVLRRRAVAAVVRGGVRDRVRRAQHRGQSGRDHRTGAHLAARAGTVAGGLRRRGGAAQTASQEQVYPFRAPPGPDRRCLSARPEPPVRDEPG